MNGIKQVNTQLKWNKHFFEPLDICILFVDILLHPLILKELQQILKYE